MIKISSLNKIYKSKKRKVCHALKNINLTLPDAGLVFVLGKSGSGKSTLLNLIGGLDNISSGSIEVDGNDLSKFREGDFCNYRNTHIGFIFQDYHLIDELTVYENIVLSLNLRRIEDKELVKAALEKVDLAGYEDRYPTELSGGERQRVAIARAIVKNPRIILADEPTGNLDTHTAKSIVELLKELSKDCLILIVSHNVNDANNYADRIIELSKGEIISDKSRNPDFADEVTLENGELIYPDGLTLKDKDIEFINDNTGAKFVKRTDKFISTPDIKDKIKNIKIERKNLSFGKELNLSGKFLKNKTVAISLSAFMVAVIMTILAMAQTIAAFDGGHIIADEMEKGNQSSLLLNKVMDEQTKAQVDGSYRVEIGENDIQAFYDAGYKGKIYPLINASLPISEYRNSIEANRSYFKSDSLQIKETLGTIIVDEEFLINKFGDIVYLAKLDDFDPAGVIITDYVADSIMQLNPKKYDSYDDIIGEYYYLTWSIGHYIINGVIDTGYKEKHKTLIDKLNNKYYSNITEIYEAPEATAFINDIYDRLGYSFSFNENFAEEYKQLISRGKVFRQKLLINDTFEIVGDDLFAYYFSWGYVPNNTLRDGWKYTTMSPDVPEGAKYIRVAFGVTSKEYDVNENPLYYLFDLENAILVFSDGSYPSKEELNYKNDTWLSVDGEELNQGGSWKKSQLSDYIEIPEGCEIQQFATYVASGYAYCAFYDENYEFINAYTPNDRVDMPEASIMMNYKDYNTIFGTNYTENNYINFVPHTIKLSQYRFSDVNNSTALFQKEVSIIAMDDSISGWILSNDLCDLFAEYQIYTNSLYFDGADGIGSVLNLVDELNYEHQSYAVEGIHSMTRAVDVFVPIFEFISIFLYIGVIFILMNFASKMINDKMHEIGILKALGTKNGTIGVVFGLQVMLVAILTCGLSTLGYYLFIDVANDILIESVKRLAPSWNMPDLQFLVFEWEIALVNCALTLVLAILSLILPMIKIKAIKPVKIIKAKE